MVLKLANDFLQIILFETGNIKLEKHVVNINELIEDIIITYNIITKNKEITLE